MKVTIERFNIISVCCGPRSKTTPTILNWYLPSGVLVISSPTQNKACPPACSPGCRLNPHLPLEFSGKSPHTNEVFQSNYGESYANSEISFSLAANDRGRFGGRVSASLRREHGSRR